MTLASLENPLRDILRDVPESARISISCCSIDGAIKLDINGFDRHVAASTMKLYVMIAACRKIDIGELDLNALIPCVNDFPSVENVARYSTRQRADADPVVYAHLGREVTVRFLIERMICYSSNLATNVLFELVTPKLLSATIASLGLSQTTVSRGIEDLPAHDPSLRNRVTANELSSTLVAIFNHTAASPALCEFMLGCLLRQHFNDEIPAALPPEVLVAHKTGWLREVQHDASIILPPDAAPFVLTVLTEGLVYNTAARSLIRQVSATIYDRRSDL